MSREELKKTLKPLIKQCIREVLLEEAGVLSKVVSEVASGLSGQVITETRNTQVQTSEREKEVNRIKTEELRRHKREMLNSIGQDAYNGVDIFEGTQPLASSGQATPSNGPMRDRDPNDPGIDITKIPGLNLDVARKLMG